MRQTRHNQSFLVGLTFGDLSEDVLAKGLASLTKLATRSLNCSNTLMARSIAAGATISSIGSVMAGTITGLKFCSNKRVAGAISPSYRKKSTKPLQVNFCGG